MVIGYRNHSTQIGAFIAANRISGTVVPSKNLHARSPLTYLLVNNTITEGHPDHLPTVFKFSDDAEYIAAAKQIFRSCRATKIQNRGLRSSE